jgi:hypothetical protein
MLLAEALHLVADLQVGNVGSDQGAVSASQPVRFPGPSAEPDVRLSPHRALHVFMPTSYAAACVCVAHGEGITAPR